MLLNRATADRIAGGTIRIDDVVEHPAGYRVTEAQARAAGYRDAAAAHAELDRRSAEHVYVITVSYAGPDERPALAADDALTADDVAVISYGWPASTPRAARDRGRGAIWS